MTTCITSGRGRGAMSSTDLMETTCRVFGVTVEELLGPSRARRIAYARFALAWALRKHDPRRSFQAIGATLGGRDHATILHAIARAEELARDDQDYALQLAELWP
jgi:chromosomal replication initiator protein